MRRHALTFWIMGCAMLAGAQSEDHQLPSPSFGGAFMDGHGQLVNQRRTDGPPWPWVGPQYLVRGIGRPVISDTSEYWYGDYGSGEPIGVWTHHLADGSYSKGPVTCSDWYTFIDTEGEEHTGCHRYYIKDGVWHYYDRDSTLVRTERYSRKFEHQVCGIDSSFYVDPSGAETLIFYRWRKSTHRDRSFFHHRERTYDDSGHLLTDSEWNHKRHRTTEYFPNGSVKRTWVATVILGIRFNRAVTTDYSADGKNKVRTVDKAWTRERIRC